MCLWRILVFGNVPIRKKFEVNPLSYMYACDIKRLTMMNCCMISHKTDNQQSCTNLQDYVLKKGLRQSCKKGANLISSLSHLLRKKGHNWFLNFKAWMVKVKWWSRHDWFLMGTIKSKVNTHTHTKKRGNKKPRKN